MSTKLDWRIRITETAHKAGFQPDAVSGALICTPAVIENFAREIERQAMERAAERLRLARLDGAATLIMDMLTDQPGWSLK